MSQKLQRRRKPKLTSDQFSQSSEAPTQTRDSVEDVWGERAPYVGDWPSRIDERVVEVPDHWVQSCCVLCSNGCALDIGVKGGQIVGVRGREADRVNRGRLGPKGLHGWLANGSADRLTKPLIRQGAKFRTATWKEAMDLIVRKTREVQKEYTSDAIAFYNSGQLFLEEYYTLSIIAHAGIGTSNIDGNTRLCTATAEQALCETFGSDGQPGSYADIDVTDCLLLVGHNMAETQTVLWSRVLDRLAGPRPPKLIVIDPRETPTAREADVHLAPRVGTNVAVLNGLLHLIIKAGHIDRGFIDQHTVGFDRLAKVVAQYPPERVEEITEIAASRLRAAAKILGSAPTLVSTVLQGVYQSHQATAAACQVNNLNLVRGLIAKPGSTVLQMNGQPTAQNTRETGCNGEFPAFRNLENPDHVADLAERWEIDAPALPRWHEHAAGKTTSASSAVWVMNASCATTKRRSCDRMVRMRCSSGKVTAGFVQTIQRNRTDPSSRNQGNSSAKRPALWVISQASRPAEFGRDHLITTGRAKVGGALLGTSHLCLRRPE